MEIVVVLWLLICAAGLAFWLCWNAVARAASWRPSPRITKPEPKKPTPTREENLAAAKERFEATITWLEAAGLDRNELDAGKLKAKQQYLRDIDGVM